MVVMRHDLRRPPPELAERTTAELYDAALAQCRFADEAGFDLVALSEHHGMDDGWLPAPLVMAAAVAGATRRIGILVSAVIGPLHDPVRLAEQVVVADHVSAGRVWTVLGAGYRPEEFAMAGVDRSRRGRILEEHLRVLLEAFTAEPFTWQGRTVRVTPAPRTRPHPPIFVGGGVPAAARRAARLGLPLLPMHDDPRLAEAYAAEAARCGTQGFVMVPAGPSYVHVTDDPDRTWAEIGPYLLHEARTYDAIQTGGQASLPHVAARTVDDLRASPNYLVGTPGEVIAAAERLPATAALTFNPLAGGLPPEVAWDNLERFRAEVLPRLGRSGRSAPA
jgi:alkanesulfonate monooxygenase SsuD/methylene tetrahydromethanopterin reductase-like flavin-dependent oxidoreductase (luciferase family)